MRVVPSELYAPSVFRFGGNPEILTVINYEAENKSGFIVQLSELPFYFRMTHAHLRFKGI